MARLTIRNISKQFGSSYAVDNFSLDVEDGELVCLLGPSGSGKSTLLRMIGGFERPSSGTVLIDARDVTHLAPEKRPTGMVFQSHALWTHMNVFDNVAFGLKLRHMSRSEIRDKVEGVLALVGLAGYGQRQTTQLSGGQQQRVALARSLVLEPKILLLDEPFASLDQHLRERLREEVKDIQQRLGITTLFVTHGQDEALALADRIVVMRDGRSEQAAPPAEVYRCPQTEFVAGFIGSMNFVRTQIVAGRTLHPDFNLPVPLDDGPVTIAFRPEALALVRNGRSGGPMVHRAIDFGTHRMVDIELSDGSRLKAMVPPVQSFDRNMLVGLTVGDFFVFRDGCLVYQHAGAGFAESDPKSVLV